MNLTHSCRRVAELLSQSMDEPLGRLDRLRLRLHLAMCDNCRHVAQQLEAVKELSSDLFSLQSSSRTGLESVDGDAVELPSTTRR